MPDAPMTLSIPYAATDRISDTRHSDVVVTVARVISGNLANSVAACSLVSTTLIATAMDAKRGTPVVQTISVDFVNLLFALVHSVFHCNPAESALL